jgi:hypothetical protein
VRGLGLLVLALLLSGCASGDADRAVEDAAAAFGAALRDGDAEAACRALAPLTREALEQTQPCPQALAAQGLPAPTGTRALHRFGRQAAVEVRAGDQTDTWFLSRFGGRWLVVAAGCTERGGQLPYDCDVEGA